MAKKNYLVEGVSGTGKSSVCDELQRRGYKAINGDRELAYQGGARPFNEVVDAMLNVLKLSSNVTHDPEPGIIPNLQ
jgi:broad-specificity NMP kinase